MAWQPILLGLLTLAMTSGCSVGYGSHARSTALPAAVLGSEAAPTSAATALPAPEDLYFQLVAINESVYGRQLLSFRAVVESLAPHLEIQGLSPADLGRTLVWDQEGSAYAPSIRSDAPAGAIRVVLYKIDSGTGRPALPLTEIGTIDMYPRNSRIGEPASAPAMRYVVSGVRADPTVYADFTAVHGEPDCACARVSGWVTDGITRVDFAAPYSVAEDEGVRFTATVHVVSQPGVLLLDATLEESLMHSDARFAFHGDSVEARGLLVFPDDEHPEGAFAVRVNGRSFSNSNADFTTVVGPHSRALTAVELMANRQLYALTYGLLLNVELPTYLTFNCGC